MRLFGSEIEHRRFGPRRGNRKLVATDQRQVTGLSPDGGTIPASHCIVTSERAEMKVAEPFMSNLWSSLKSISQNRTGMAIGSEYEEDSRIELKAGSWLILLAVAVAFALVLQMETDRLHDHKNSVEVSQSVQIP